MWHCVVMDIELNPSSSITLNAQQINVKLSQANCTGNYSIIGKSGFNGVLFDTHIHSGVMAGPSNTGPVAG